MQNQYQVFINFHDTLVIFAIFVTNKIKLATVLLFIDNICEQRCRMACQSCESVNADISVNATKRVRNFAATVTESGLCDW